MIASMTGFANVTRPIAGGGVGGTLSFEIKSVNSRFLDLSFRFPDELRALEMPLRELLGKELARGKVECRAGWALKAGDATETLDPARLQRLQDLAREVQTVFGDSRGLSTSDVLRWPGGGGVAQSGGYGGRRVVWCVLRRRRRGNPTGNRCRGR